MSNPSRLSHASLLSRRLLSLRPHSLCRRSLCRRSLCRRSLCRRSLCRRSLCRRSLRPHSLCRLSLRPLSLLAAIPLLLAPTVRAQYAGITLQNGVDGYVEVPYSPAVVPQGGITCEAWVSYDDATLPTGWRYPTVLRQNLNASTEAYFLRIEANNVGARVLRWKIETATNEVPVDWPFAPGQLLTWTHVAGTYDGTASRLFVNGQEVASAAGNGTPIVDRGDVLRIGKGSDIGGPIEVWNGSLDEVRIWPFARTAQQILSTMNDELTSVPGQVSTWNLNNDFRDTSSGRDGTATGAVAFTATVPTLSNQPFPGIALGSSTPGCVGAIEASVAGLPRVGNQAFAVVGHRVPAAAPTIALVGLRTINPPFRLVGIDVWLDPTFLVGGYTATVDALGTARLGLPIPAGIRPAGSVAFQLVAVDACGPQGLTASNAVGFGIIP